MITKVQKVCDCCGKSVAEKAGFLKWRLLSGYVTVRMKDTIKTVDPEDGIPYFEDTTTDLHCCKQCWSGIVKKYSRW